MSTNNFRKKYRKLLDKVAKIDDKDLLIRCLSGLYKAPLTFPADLKKLKRFKSLAAQFSQLRNELGGNAKKFEIIACAEITAVMQQQGVVLVAKKSHAELLASPVSETLEVLPAAIAKHSVYVAPDANKTYLQSGVAGSFSLGASPEQSTNIAISGGGLLGQSVWEKGRANSDMGRSGPSHAVPAENASELTNPEESPPQPGKPRFLNAEIAGHSNDTPLDIHKTYKLEFSVALEKAKNANAAVRLPDSELIFEKHEEDIELSVEVFSEDFKVAQSPVLLKVPRLGPSKDKARFDITPLKTGRASLTATILKAGNFLFQMEISYSIGTTEAETKPASVVTHGRPLDAATDLKPREVGMVIHPAANGYELTVWGGASAKKVTLPITEAELDDAIKAAREALIGVILQRDEKQDLVFQQGLEIDVDSQSRALRSLARAGATLFQRIFFGPLCGADVQRVGEFLRDQFSKPDVTLKLQIVAERFPIPWGLIYLGPIARDAPLDWKLFLGMSHIIEQIPLQPNLGIQDSLIKSDDPSLAVSVNVHAGIDAQMKSDFVGRQLEYWDNCSEGFGARMRVTKRQSRTELLAALTNSANDQLMYLYCHAVTSNLGDPGGINGSHIVLTGDEQLMLGDLNLEAPMTEHLLGQPLIFINACESAELSPSFYDGFVPYFMAKGARGVVGTECKTPALFASEWALRFFPRFLAGKPIGELFLNLRQEFLTEHRNPLGLVYAVYCDGDTQIHPGLS
ncbi:CHAT domain-containing protein [Marinobacter adhaerens]|jgi:hypothetical protein|uniref:CHAT domain-containing protein n=2 Tax=Marinobacter adhaerens TaxID=1033846 RepID=A0ABX8IMX3_9GAMM|nr:CHAT domain-containing protein [Marinobacter adhaerens]ADP96972.1 conserved hypothetical protein [Marinobacter adhaerens HP15]MBW4980456.1 CHAT domain-containing protein [Marinobacter adhaerens]QWV14918.1 CHAT domain-containing protein [Marinobacter adhaerens]